MVYDRTQWLSLGIASTCGRAEGSDDMPSRDSMRHGASRLRPRTQMLRRIGDELISSETVAVIELVKNAYDADATRVLVRFQGPLEIGQGRIEVMDNGH